MLPPSVPPPDVLAGVDDLIRSSLEGFAEVWFIRLLVFTALVFVGLVFEAPEIWHETVGSLRRLCRRPAIKRELYPLAKLAGTVGWFLIVVGVAGELVAEGFLFKADGLVVKFDEILLADTTKSAGAAQSSAIKAADAAKVAKDQSDAAVSSASNALGLAKGARQEADSFAHDIAGAKQEAADAVSRLADAEQRLAGATQREAAAEEALRNIKMPRSLIHTDELTTALKPYKGTEYILNTFMDNESIQFTRASGNELEAAGWVRKQPAGLNLGIPAMDVVFHEGSAKEIVPSCVETGISIHAHTKQAPGVLQAMPFSQLSQSIRAALVFSNSVAPSISPADTGNVQVGVVDPKPEEESAPMTICVGKKP